MNIHLYDNFNSFGRRILKLVILITLRFSDEEDIISFYLFTSLLFEVIENTGILLSPF